METGATIEMEKKLLSALLVDGGYKSLPQASKTLAPEDLYRPEHQRIYSAMLRLGSQGVEFDVLVLENELARTDELKLVTHGYLFGLLTLEYTTARIEYYCSELKEASALRRLAEIGRELADEATKERGTAEELTAKYTEKITAQKITSNQATLSEICAGVFGELIELWRTGEQKRGLPSGFENVDKIIGGLKKSDLLIIAGRPAMGKTTFALNIAYNTARSGNPVLYFSLEMSKEQLVERLLSNISRVPMEKLRDGVFMQNQEKLMSRVVDAAGELSEVPLSIDDTGSANLYEIKSRTRLAARQECSVVFIDHLQLIQGSGAYKGNRVQEVSDITRQLKGLARELNLPIILLSQLSRQVEMRAEKKPQLSDLRDSGSIEQDADVVMLLYREKYYDSEAIQRGMSQDEEILQVIVAKNRHGQTKMTDVRYIPAIQRCETMWRDSD